MKSGYMELQLANTNGGNKVVMDMEINENDNEATSINPQIGKNQKKYKSLQKILFRVINLCLSSFYFGYTLAYLGSFDFKSMVTLYQIKQNVQLNQGLLQAVITIGAGVGALTSGIVMRNFSRRNSILFINAFAFVFGIFVLIPNLNLFFVARFFQGMCVGQFSAIVPLLIKQYCPNELSGAFGALNQTFIAFGVFFAFTFQIILLQLNQQLEHWRIEHGFTLITIAIQTLLLVLVYRQETPKYLLQTNQEQKCIKLIKELYQPQFVTAVLKQKKADLNLSETKNELQKNEKNQKQTLQQIQVPLDFQKGKKLRISAAVHLAVLQQFVGINAVVAYGVQIVQKVVPTLQKIVPAILNFEVLVGGLLSTLLLRKVGRVAILQAGTLVSCISLLFVAIGFILQSSNTQAGNVLVMIGLFIYMLNFGLSLGPVVWLYIAEIVEPNIIPFSTLANWATATVVILLFPVLSNAFGTPVPLFFFFAIWSFISLLVNGRILVESKQKTEKQIRQQFCLK